MASWSVGPPWKRFSIIRLPQRIAADRKRIEARRGKNIAKFAAAQKLLTLLYYGLRDGQIRALATDAA